MKLVDLDDRKYEDRNIDDEMRENRSKEEFRIVDFADAINFRFPKLMNRDAMEDSKESLPYNVSTIFAH